MMRRYAFTLVELLVVLAVIVLLTALLVPSLGMPRNHARKVRCQATRTQVGLALQSSGSQNNDSAPTAYIIDLKKSLLNPKLPPNAGTVPPHWHEQLIADGCIRQNLNPKN